MNHSLGEGMMKMRRKILVPVVFVLVLGIVPAYAGDAGTKGASSKAYEHASDQSIFNRVGDWFSTVGKSDEEKEVILQKRREMRAARRAEREAHKIERKGDEAARASDDRSEKMNRKEERRRESHGDDRSEEEERNEADHAKSRDDDSTERVEKEYRNKEKDSRMKKEQIREKGSKKGY
jgi:hypothetical protein